MTTRDYTILYQLMGFSVGLEVPNGLDVCWIYHSSQVEMNSLVF